MPLHIKFWEALTQDSEVCQVILGHPSHPKLIIVLIMKYMYSFAKHLPSLFQEQEMFWAPWGCNETQLCLSLEGVYSLMSEWGGGNKTHAYMETNGRSKWHKKQ